MFAPDNNSQLRLVDIDCAIPDGTVTGLRFLVPEGKGSLNVMQFVNGSWKNVEFRENGHYLIVDDPVLDNGTAYYCIQLRQLEFIPIIIIGGCVVIALINVILWTILIKRRRAAKKAAAAESGTDTGDKAESADDKTETADNK